MSIAAGKVYAVEIIPVSFCDFVSEPASVIFFSGCNFDCGYCQNWNLKKQLPEHLTDISAIKDALSRNKLISACKITGGEPLLQTDPLLEIGHFSKSIGLKFGIDTNGSLPDKLEEALPLLDLISMDIKAPLEPSAYSRVTSVPSPDLEAIRKSLKIAISSDAYLDLRMVIIPGYNDDALKMGTIESELRAAGYDKKQAANKASFTIVEFLPENAHFALFHMASNPSAEKLREIASCLTIKGVRITHRALGGCLMRE